MGKEMSSLPGRSGMAIDIDTFLSTSARSMRRSLIRELLKLTSRGGITWVRLPETMDTEVLLREAVEAEKVAYVIGSGFFADGGGRHTMRLNFSFPSEQEIDQGIRRLARLVRRHLPVAISSIRRRTTVSD